jgi:hypothetical protein
MEKVRVLCAADLSHTDHVLRDNGIGRRASDDTRAARLREKERRRVSLNVKFLFPVLRVIVSQSLSSYVSLSLHRVVLLPSFVPFSSFLVVSLSFHTLWK